MIRRRGGKNTRHKTKPQSRIRAQNKYHGGGTRSLGVLLAVHLRLKVAGRALLWLRPKVNHGGHEQPRML